MGVPPEFYMQFILSVFSIVLTTAIGYWVKRISDRDSERKREERAREEELRQAEQKRKEEYDALKDGILAILRDRIIQADIHSSSTGGATMSQKTNVQMMYASYHRLGGNSIATQSYEHVISLPILAEEVKT